MQGFVCWQFRAAFALFFVIAGAFGQSNTGSLAGRVTDTSEGVIPGAKVVVTNDLTGVTTITTTTGEGLYQFPSLAVGSYTIQVEHPGFRALRQTGITLAIATRASVDLR